MKNVEVIYKIKTAAENQILAHLKECNENFLPPLAERVEIAGYSQKLFEKSVTFEAWKAGYLVGLLAAYINKGAQNSAYITNVSVSNSCIGKGIASTLLRNCVGYATEQGCDVINLEVHKANNSAIGLYQKFGFVITGETEKFFFWNEKGFNHDGFQERLRPGRQGRAWT